MQAKIEMSNWPARMHTALMECVTTPGQDKMRFALLLFNRSALRAFTQSRFAERRVDRCGISFFARRPGVKFKAKVGQCFRVKVGQ
jgi:hypothetical protein